MLRRPGRRINGGRGVGSSGPDGGVIPPSKALVTETLVLLTTEAGTVLVTET